MPRTICLLILLHIATSMYAQIGHTRLTDYHRANPWSEGNNPAGLVFNPTSSLSIAEAGYNYTSGQLRMMAEAPEIQSYRVSSKSYQKLKSIRLYGFIGYSDTYYRNSRWNGTIPPGRHLFSIGDTAAGQKHYETFSISGHFAIPLSEHWGIGAGVDYHARSCNKNTEPRHSNNQADLKFLPGLAYSAGNFRAGANFIYHRIIEDVQYQNSIYEIRAYYPLGFYYSTGLNDNTRKYEDLRYGAAVQVQVDGDKYRWFNEISYHTGHETTHIFLAQGKKAGKTERSEVSYTGQLKLHNRLEHVFKPSFYYLSLTGYEYLQGKLNNTSHSKVEDYGQIRRSTIQTQEASFRYTLASPGEGLSYRWAFHAGTKYFREQTLFFMYPSLLKQTISQLVFFSDFQHRINFHQHSFDISAGMECRSGKGDFPEDYSSNQPPLPEINLSQHQELVLHDFQIQTISSLTACLNLQYTLPLKERLSVFGLINSSYCHSLSSLIRQHRLNANFSMGILF